MVTTMESLTTTKPAIAQILGKKKVTNYDLAMFQKVPFMINMPG